MKNEDEIDEYHKFIYKVYLLNYTKLKKNFKKLNWAFEVFKVKNLVFKNPILQPPPLLLSSVRGLSAMVPTLQ